MSKEKMEFQSLPIKFEFQPFEDETLKKVKILVMHEGLNLNGSTFNESAIEKAKDSIVNRPILAYVTEVDGTDEKDFKGHEDEVIFTEDGMKYRYKGRPIGVIPANECDYHYEIYGDKKYVAVTGYIWSDYANEALDILERDVEKGQSMEIKVNESSIDEQGNYIIDDYTYLGLTLLGEGIQPAMEGAKVQMFTKQNDDFNKMVTEVETILKKYSAKEVKDVVDVEEQIVEPIVEEQIVDPIEVIEETVVEETVVDEEPIVEEVVVDEVFELKGSLAKMTEELSLAKTEVENLKALNQELESFRTKKIAEEERVAKEGLLNSFSKALNQESVEKIKEDFDTYTLENLEVTLNKLFALQNLKAYTVEEPIKGIPIDIARKENKKSRYAV